MGNFLIEVIGQSSLEGGFQTTQLSDEGKLKYVDYLLGIIRHWVHQHSRDSQFPPPTYTPMWVISQEGRKPITDASQESLISLTKWEDTHSF